MRAFLVILIILSLNIVLCTKETYETCRKDKCYVKDMCKNDDECEAAVQDFYACYEKNGKKYKLSTNPHIYITNHRW